MVFDRLITEQRYIGEFLEQGKVSKKRLEENVQHKDETFCDVKDGDRPME